ncbi:hypothetical protein CN463_28225 [Bacillus cereus]|uniref:DUF1611 domain-containing protein n=1 Tax=Bacillus cereus TaxID=1396 RepID=UPI000BEC0C62|nr:DUF1611 domain-containing protein [Bacillus cereus]PED02704.1 hypothetical protein CON14_11545 [Bacillus cereus]PED87760.1 hypothetical protein CON43_16140 [Bacillus cereus]PEQ80805.1 hypothetical protein CN482_23575 [Bacillus cereus]PER61132.1 hypothetical protein CN503_24210 [Bacillus cereus]PES13060.1 hypothetical protein CN501_15430 [Bacillus cereus]
MKTILWVEGKFGEQTSKMASGILRYGTRYEIVAVIDSTKAGSDSGLVLNGILNNIPIVGNIQEALAYDPECFLIGLAPDNCVDYISKDVRDVIKEAMYAKLNIISGMFASISDDSELRELSQKLKIKIQDVRKLESLSRTFTGEIMTKKTKVLLTVGTDWSVGKMTTALELLKCLRKKGYKVAFVATGQTGILCGAEVGIPVDNLRTSYMTGAIEGAILELDNKGYDLIIVEGQGCITHPNGVGCPISLLNGSNPDYIVMCHDLNRKNRKFFSDFEISSIEKNLESINFMHLDDSNPKLVGISIMTGNMEKMLVEQQVLDLEVKYRVPVVDSRKNGVTKIVENLEKYLNVTSKQSKLVLKNNI